MKWELIDSDENGYLVTMRMRAVDGWIVLTRASNDYGSSNASMVYVPDVNNKWEIKDETKEEDDKRTSGCGIDLRASGESEEKGRKD